MGAVFLFHVLHSHDGTLHSDAAAIAVVYHGVAVHSEDADETGMGFQQVASLGVDTHHALTAIVMDDDVTADIVVVADHAEQAHDGAYDQYVVQECTGHSQGLFPVDSHENSSHVGRLVTTAGLSVVAWFAERVPVIFIPEQPLVPAMRDDVVNDGRRGEFAFAHTFRTQRMALEVRTPGSAPLGVVPSRISTAANTVCAVLLVFPAVHAAVAEIGASGEAAWAARCPWHIGHLTSPA